MDKDNKIYSKEFLQEINRLINLKKLQLDLLDNLGSTIMWIFNYAKKTNTDVPDLEGLSYLLHRVNRAMKIMYPDDVKLSDENLQSDENDENRRRFDENPFGGAVKSSSDKSAVKNRRVCILRHVTFAGMLLHPVVYEDEK